MKSRAAGCTEELGLGLQHGQVGQIVPQRHTRTNIGKDNPSLGGVKGEAGTSPCRKCSIRNDGRKEPSTCKDFQAKLSCSPDFKKHCSRCVNLDLGIWTGVSL